MTICKFLALNTVEDIQLMDLLFHCHVTKCLHTKTCAFNVEDTCFYVKMRTFYRKLTNPLMPVKLWFVMRHLNYNFI